MKAGLVDAGVVAIDGTKIAANVSMFAIRDREPLTAELACHAELSEAGDPVGEAANVIAKEILKEAEAVDADAEDGEGRGGELPAEWAGGRDRRVRIRAALDELVSQKARDFESPMAERARPEAERGS